MSWQTQLSGEAVSWLKTKQAGAIVSSLLFNLTE